MLGRFDVGDRSGRVEGRTGVWQEIGRRTPPPTASGRWGRVPWYSEVPHSEAGIEGRGRCEVALGRSQDVDRQCEKKENGTGGHCDDGDQCEGPLFPIFELILADHLLHLTYGNSNDRNLFNDGDKRTYRV